MLRLAPRSRRARRILVGILATVGLLYISSAAFIWRAMHQPPEVFGRLMSKLPGPVPFLLFPFETMWLRARAGSLQPGSLAPDFSLLKVDKSERVQLSVLNKQQPVVLVFGSYT
jgi:hypothetical protein